jgi:HlyD family secretion protein
MNARRPHCSLAAGLALLAALAALGCGRETLHLVGTVERQSHEIAAPRSEKIVAIPVEVGQRVAAGEVVVQLDDEVAQLELQAQEARHAAAEANLAAAAREYERVRGLQRARVSSASDLDLAKRANDEAVALVAEQAARVAQARRTLADLTLEAPADGVVDQLPFEQGERVPAGGVAAVVLADVRPWVRLWLPARAVARLRPGAPAEVEIEGLSGRFKGRLEDVAREPEFTPHFALTERERANLVYEARVRLEDAPADLRPGLPATVRLRLAGEQRSGEQ